MGPIQGIVQFNVDRGLTTFDVGAEYSMLTEELQEFYSAETTDKTVDGLCDIVVVAIGALHKLGYNPEAALMETVKEITSRHGALDETTGKWQKDPKQDPKTLYAANYVLAKR
jgi:hypothetical protein